MNPPYAGLQVLLICQCPPSPALNSLPRGWPGGRGFKMPGRPSPPTAPTHTLRKRRPLIPLINTHVRKQTMIFWSRQVRTGLCFIAYQGPIGLALLHQAPSTGSLWAGAAGCLGLLLLLHALLFCCCVCLGRACVVGSGGSWCKPSGIPTCVLPLTQLSLSPQVPQGTYGPSPPTKTLMPLNHHFQTPWDFFF